MLLYISGRYSAATLAERQENIAKARACAGELWTRGHAVICPHLNTANFEDDFPAIDYDAYIAGDLLLVERCDAVVMLPGWEQSKGAKIERTHAEKEGIPVYEWPCEIPLEEPQELPPTPATVEAIAISAAGFTVKDSGKRQQFASGMVRDTTTGKPNPALCLDGPMFRRWAAHMTRGAAKYTARNWMQADGSAELERFKESAFRHFLQWYYGDTDEDHAAAVYFNLNGAEYVADRMKQDAKAKAA